MSIDVSRAIREGVTRTATPRGAVFVLLFLLIGLVGNVAFDSATQILLALAEEVGEEPLTPVPPEATPFALPLPGTVIVLMIGLWVLGWAVGGVLAMRALVADPAEPIRLSRLGSASANELAARILTWVLIGIGLVLLVVPGVILAVGLFFVRPLIAVEDRTFVEAMIESWEYAKGQRFDLFILLVVTGVLYLFILAPGTVAVLIAPSAPVVAGLVSLIFSALGTVFWFGVIASTYTQLGDGAPADDAAEVDDRPADLDEWDDPPGVDW